MVQMCLANPEGVSQFIQEMKSIAKTETMDYVDGSASTQRGLEAIHSAYAERKDGSPLIHIGVLRQDSMGVTAGSVGLPGYQVLLGFSEGSSSKDAHEFADRMINRLGQRWKVEAVPDGMGAKPLAGCR
jgi:hypothetical protein